MNRLAGEKSPYLRQHAGNPVDWFPWGPEAFAKAKAEGKPIFLSIGYSACHWCHVMADESFADPAIAARLNADFVPVKVDREERPDVDRVYMAYLQALTGQGGWPLSAWLTPELKPFYAGTYFPPEDRAGRAGFPSILRAISEGWQKDRAKLVAEGEKALEALRVPEAAAAAAPRFDDRNAVHRGNLAHQANEAFEACFSHYEQAFDQARGGFGGAPKFPRASNLSFLFRCAAIQGLGSSEGQAAVRMAARTLQAMARGGIHHQVGGGVHRDSVDADWFVPHFEKMLYDQAQIAVNALEAWQATGDERHAWLARDILEYTLRDLAAPDGGFYSAEDADSADAAGKHAEGAFYVWTRDEIEAAAGEDAEFVCRHFGVRPEGNVPAERDPHGEFHEKNILAQAAPLAETAAQFGLDPQGASDRLERALGRLRQARARRPRPARDEKILAAWNGLAISALARAAAAPSEALADRRESYLRAAVRAAEFLRREMADGGRGVLFRAWLEGRGAVEGFAEDYAFVIQGLLDLDEAGFDAGWLRWAEALQGKLDELFWDEAAGGYFNSAAGAGDMILRLKEDYDGAEPAPNSVAASNLLRLSAIRGDAGLEARARRALAAFQPQWSQVPQALPQMLCSLELALSPPRHVVLAGDPGSADFRALAEACHERLGPARTLLAASGGADQAWLSERSPWLEAMRPVGGRAAAYVCRDRACQLPVTEPEALRALLAGGER